MDRSKKDDIPENDKLGEYLYKLDRCDNNVQINIKPEEVPIHSVEHTVFSSFLKKECERQKRDKSMEKQ